MHFALSSIVILGRGYSTGEIAAGAESEVTAGVTADEVAAGAAACKVSDQTWLP